MIDSRGNPTVEADLVTEDGLFKRRASVVYECRNCRLETEEIDTWKGVLNAVKSVNEVLAKELIGMDVRDQAIDAKMIDLDERPTNEPVPTRSWQYLWRHRLDSSGRIPLYKLCDLAGNPMTSADLPVPCFNVINGGEHAGNNHFRSFRFPPERPVSLTECKWDVRSFITKKVIKAKFGGDATLIGEEDLPLV